MLWYRKRHNNSREETPIQELLQRDAAQNYYIRRSNYVNKYFQKKFPSTGEK